MKKLVCIIGSGQRTIWDDDPMAPPTPAMEAYRSRLLRLAFSYADLCCEKAYILSPTLGFLTPHEVIKYHEEDPRGPVKEGKVLDNARRTVHKLEVAPGDVIVVLGGLWHYEVVRTLFPHNTVYAPLRGRTINDKYRYLRNIIKNIQTGRGGCIPSP